MSNNLIRYFLPTLYKDDFLANVVLGAIKDSTDRFRDFAMDAFNQCCAGLATWGLDDWERELAITPPENATLELRRAMVKAKLMRPPTMTPAQIVAIANCFVPKKDARLMPVTRPYTFRIVAPSPIPWISEMMDAVYEAKPAHLGMEMEIHRQIGSNLFISTLQRKCGRKYFGLPLPEPIRTDLHVGVLCRRSGSRFFALPPPDPVTTNLHAIIICRKSGRKRIGG